jgi:hypothetical protein
MPASHETAVGRGDRPVSWVVDATAADDMCSLAGAGAHVRRTVRWRFRERCTVAAAAITQTQVDGHPNARYSERGPAGPTNAKRRASSQPAHVCSIPV